MLRQTGAPYLGQNRKVYKHRTHRNFRQSPKIYFNLSKDPSLSLRPARQRLTPPDPPHSFLASGRTSPPPARPPLVGVQNHFYVVSGAGGWDAKTPTGVTSCLSRICPAEVSWRSLARVRRLGTPRQRGWYVNVPMRATPLSIEVNINRLAKFPTQNINRVILS